jgi:uncharacterized membrane protein required for colicin V production
VNILTEFSWIDLVVIVILAAAVFVGYMQGIIRYALSAIAVIVAFIVASQLKTPISDALGFWTPTSPEAKEIWLFVFLFIGLVIAGWFIVRAFYRRTRLPVAKQIDEIGGAILALLFTALVLTFSLVVLDSFFQTAPSGEVANAGILNGYYQAMNSSLIIQFFRNTLIPTAGFIARPFVPAEIATFLNVQ